jgi:hypothetical protein
MLIEHCSPTVYCTVGFEVHGFNSETPHPLNTGRTHSALDETIQLKVVLTLKSEP